MPEPVSIIAWLSRPTCTKYSIGRYYYYYYYYYYST
jgi:hypothetical protein